MTIERTAIAYGDSRYGRSCANCNYVEKGIMETTCGLHGLKTGLGKCCGTWSNDKRPKPVEKNCELFT